jgi:hypothetical protein
MKIIKQLLFAFLLVLPTLSIGQEKKDNRNFFKLYITNDKSEIMLIKFDDSWEIPGAGYKGTQTISQFLDTIANDHGITIKDKKLRGQITFHHEIRDNPTIMLYYTAKYQNGNLKTPEWGQEVKWFSLKEAYKIIPFPEMIDIIKKINEDKKTVWGGALKITYDKESNKRKGFEKIEEYYKLN